MMDSNLNLANGPGVEPLVSGTGTAGASQLLPMLERIAVALQTIARVQRPEKTGLSPAISDGNPGSSGESVSPHTTPGVTADAITKLDAQLTEIRGLLKRHDSLLRPMEKKSYSVDEVAELTGYKAWTIRQGCNKQRIKGRKGDDGRWRVPQEEVARLQEEGLPAE